MDSLKLLDFSSFIIFSDDPWSLLVSFCQLFKLPLVVQCCDVICEWPLTILHTLATFVWSTYPDTHTQILSAVIVGPSVPCVSVARHDDCRGWHVKVAIHWWHWWQVRAVQLSPTFQPPSDTTLGFVYDQPPHITLNYPNTFLEKSLSMLGSFLVFTKTFSLSTFNSMNLFQA